ncbi:MAG: di-heme oxidoredictase family protein [Kiloniellales bacterium]|nr:di-heme oxidoredictase family protein [Kiloniellales bacterium]
MPDPRFPIEGLRRRPRRAAAALCLAGLLAPAGCGPPGDLLNAPAAAPKVDFGDPSVYRDPDAPELAYGSDDAYDGTKFFQERCLSSNPVAYCAVLDGPFKLPVGFPAGQAEAEFLRGNRIFNANWAPAGRFDSGARDGIGPHYDALGCARCHVKNGRGRPPDPAAGDLGTLILKISQPGAAPAAPPEPDPRYGGQLNYRAVAGLRPKGRIDVSYEEIPGRFADGESYSLRRPRFTVAEPAYGPFPTALETSPRLPPPVIGLGLVEALSEDDLLARADPEDADGDGISGRANYVIDPEDGRRKIGRFGWKAGAASLRQQTAGALSSDMGVTSPVFPQPNCPAAEPLCRAQPQGDRPEISETDLDALVFYMQLLSPAGRRGTSDPRVVEGAELFEDIGCAACHTVQMTSGRHAEAGVLSDLVFHPYSDFLLHDMGEGLADGRREFLASGREWRTPPLWGLGRTRELGGRAHYLHDGRARSPAEAILWHGGEGAASRDAFRRLPKAQREALLRFLESL